MNIVIKKTNEADKAYEIAKKLPNFFNEKGLESIKKDTKEHLLFGAFIDKDMVGFVSYKELNPEAIEISWTAISPEFQGRGIGSKLINDSLMQIKGEHKVCEVKTLSDIHPDPGYQKTRSFYKKLGFIPLETIHPYPDWGEESPCQIFVKFLN